MTEQPGHDHTATPEAPIGLRPPRLVPLDPDNERTAVAILTELLARFASRHADTKTSPDPSGHN